MPTFIPKIKDYGILYQYFQLQYYKFFLVLINILLTNNLKSFIEKKLLFISLFKIDHFKKVGVNT